MNKKLNKIQDRGWGKSRWWIKKLINEIFLKNAKRYCVDPKSKCILTKEPFWTWNLLYINKGKIENFINNWSKDELSKRTLKQLQAIKCQSVLDSKSFWLIIYHHDYNFHHPPFLQCLKVFFLVGAKGLTSKRFSSKCIRNTKKRGNSFL